MERIVAKQAAGGIIVTMHWLLWMGILGFTSPGCIPGWCAAADLREPRWGSFPALPFAVGAAANVAGGYVSDLGGSGLGVRSGRTIVGIVCLSVAALLLIATALTESKIGAIALLTAGFGIMDLMLPSAWAVCLDIGGQHAGSVTGAMNSAGQFGGFDHHSVLAT